VTPAAYNAANAYKIWPTFYNVNPPTSSEAYSSYLRTNRSVVFARWSQCAPLLIPVPWAHICRQMASRSVYIRFCRARRCGQHTGTTTTERAMSAAIGRIYTIRPETADYIQNPLLVFVVDLSYCLLYMRSPTNRGN